MSTTIFEGSQVREIELLDLFPAQEGQVSQYFGRIGSGKTFKAVKDLLHLLEQGNVVYVNFPVHYEGFDQRANLFYVIASVLMPWKKRFYRFPKKNLRLLKIDEHFHDNFQKLTDCHIFLDEGHVVFDSYEMAKMSIEKRMSVLHTRHFNRSIHIVSQRPTAIHVTMRANVNVFYKTEKVLHWGSLILFRCTEFQDMAGETVDETQPVRSKYYFGSRAVMRAYDTRYLRGNTKASQKVHFEAYDFGYFSRLRLLILHLFRPFMRKGIDIKRDVGVSLSDSVGVEPYKITIKKWDYSAEVEKAKSETSVGRPGVMSGTLSG